MSHHIVVGVYDAESDAAAAVRDLEAANVPTSAISQHTKADFGGSDFSSANAITHKKGFWGRLFSTTAVDDSDDLHRSIERGSTVVTVAVADEDADRVSAILESHDPIDLSQESAEDDSSEAPGAVVDTPQIDELPRVRRYVVQTVEIETDPHGKPTL